MSSLIHLIKLKGHFKSSYSNLVDFHQIHVRNLFLFVFALSLSRQFFGDNIVCNLYREGVSQHFVQSACFVNGTETPRTGQKNLSHHYYQWVQIVMLLAAFNFYMPFKIWTKLFGWYLEQLTTKIDSIESATRTLQLLRISNGNCMFWKTWALEIFYLIHLIAHIFLFDTFVDNIWSSHGWRLKNITNTIFPDEGVCWFRVFSTADWNYVKVMCFLPLNCLYRKVFVFLWFLTVSLLAMHAFVFTYRVYLLKKWSPKQINAWWCFKIAQNTAAVTFEWKKEFENSWYEQGSGFDSGISSSLTSQNRKQLNEDILLQPTGKSTQAM